MDFQGIAPREENTQPVGDRALGVIEAAEEDAVAPFDLIGDHLPGIELKPQGVEDNRVRDFQELDRERQQFVARQAAMTFVKSFGQGKGDPGPRPDHGRLFDAEFHREGIGRLKADAPDVAGEPVGIFRNHLDRIGAIRLVNPHRARCADPMGMQEDHDLADRPLFRPTRGNPIGTLRSNAGNFPQPMRLGFDDVEHLGTEGLDEFAGISRTNATDHPGAEIFFDSLCRGGRGRF